MKGKCDAAGDSRGRDEAWGDLGGAHSVKAITWFYLDKNSVICPTTVTAHIKNNSKNPHKAPRKAAYACADWAGGLAIKACILPRSKPAPS